MPATITKLVSDRKLGSIVDTKNIVIGGLEQDIDRLVELIDVQQMMCNAGIMGCFY